VVALVALHVSHASRLGFGVNRGGLTFGGQGKGLDGYIGSGERLNGIPIG